MKNLAKMYYIWPAVILVGLSLVAFVALSAASTYAETSAVDTVTIKVPVACSLSSTLDTDHTASIQAGQYKDNIGTTTFKALCNDTTGFAIYAIGYSADTYGNTTMINTADNTKVINTGTNTSGSPSSWAMKLTPVSGTYIPTIENGYNNYSVVPSTYTKVATFDRATDLTIGASIKSTYAVNISRTETAGTYVGKVKYTLVHPNDADPPTQPHAATPKCISYWPNASGVVDSMADDCKSGPNGGGYSNDADATLWATNFRRDGYGFAGWSDKFDWVLNENDENGNGTGPNAGYHIYGPNQSITTPSDMTTKGLSLYAIWIPAQGTLQSFTTSQCNAMNIGEVTALKDARDHNAYTVAKLKDGKCWMVENLRLDNTAEHNSDGSLAQGYASNFIGLADPETANFNANSVANSLYSTDGSTSAPAITGSDIGYRFPRFNNQNTASPAINMTGTDYRTYSYGNWYTWSAVVADTSYYGANNQVVSSTSICPAGWRLPSGGKASATGSTTGVNVTGDPSTFRDFYNLGYAIMGSNKTAYEDTVNSGYSYYSSNTTNADGKTATAAFRSYPNNFIYSGYFYGSSASDLGSDGYYWSSSVCGYSSSYELILGGSGVHPGTGNSGFRNKDSGSSVRCLVGS